jgi:hypothetical protein
VLFVLSIPLERFIPSKLLDNDELIEPVTITDPVATITLPDCTKLTEPVNCSPELLLKTNLPKALLNTRGLVPDVPEVPLLPLVPDVPDVTLEPDVPDEPLVPEDPDVPELPEDPLVPEEPELPDVPLVPLEPACVIKDHNVGADGGGVDCAKLNAIHI